MKVTIIENDSNKAVATYPVFISGQNYVPSDEEYQSSAWNNAVEDNLVDPKERNKYSFSLDE